MVQTHPSKDLSSFVTAKTLNFFERLDIQTDFLKFDPETWIYRQDYLEALSICKNISVVNDAAERGIKLITEYNNIILLYFL